MDEISKILENTNEQSIEHQWNEVKTQSRKWLNRYSVTRSPLVKKYGSTTTVKRL